MQRSLRYLFSLSSFCILASATTWTQEVPHVAIKSRVAQLTMSFTGTTTFSPNGELYYKFTVHNTSAHAVTGNTIIIVPNTVPQKDGQFFCDARCLWTGAGDLPAGGNSDLTFSGQQLDNAQALVIEAALFDDGSYAGDEQSAAMLATNKIGF